MKNEHKSRNRKYRRVYPYECIGGCNKRRIAFNWERAKAKICVRCEKMQPPADMPSLFENITQTT